MDKQVLEILQTQEKIEKNAYQSPNAIMDMIRNDFINNSEVLQAINENGNNLVELFNAPTLVPFANKFPILVRKCDFFRSHSPVLHRRRCDHI